jgi:peptide/nickel transport system substrate-binding protein
MRDDRSSVTRRAGYPLSRRAALKAGSLGIAGTAFAGVPSLATMGLPLSQVLAAQGTPGGTLVIGKPGEILDFDPGQSASQVTWEIQAVVYESLVFLDDTLQPVPGLAERWDTPDDRTYIFHLRQGVTFHNGREMVADDVVFSLNRLLEPEEQSWWAVKLAPYDAPEAAAATPAASPEASPAATPEALQLGLTIEATGQYEVRVTLSEPYAPLLQALSATTTSIVPAQEVQSGEIDLTREMVGTGPFLVAEHVEDQRWVMRRFDGYWQEGKPLLDEVIWRVMPDESSRVAALRTGEIQLTMFENPKMLDLLANDPNVTAQEQLTTNYYVLFVNANQPELADQRVRQAISLAMDREQIVQLALFGRAAVSGPIPAGFTELATPLAELAFYTRDVERARSLLAEAGHGSGLNLQILVTPAIPATVTTAEILKVQLAEAGINLEIVQRDIATFVNEYAVEGTSQLAISWWAGYSDPYLVLVELGSNIFGPLIGMADPAVDALIGQAARETDPATRRTVLRELETAIATLGNYQPLASRNNFVAWRNDQLENVTLAQVDGFGLPLWHRLQEVSVTQ